MPYNPQVVKKKEDGTVTSDFPFFYTAAGARSHMKCFMLQEYGLDLGDKVLFPKWRSWWKAYLGEVLKPNRKMKVNTVHGSVLS